MTRGKPFKKGDARINRKGRPKSFDALRDLAQEIAHEEAQSKGETVVINGKKVTVAEVILRQWAQSPKMQQHFMEIAFGKVPNVNELTGKGGEPIEFRDGLTDEQRANRILALFASVEKESDK
jgi:hypothetical protein